MGIDNKMKYKVVLAACFGSRNNPTCLDIESMSAAEHPITPVIINSDAKLYLRPNPKKLPQDLLGSVASGLLYTRAEFDELMDLLGKPQVGEVEQGVAIEEDLRNTLFLWTNGHAGAIKDMWEALFIYVRCLHRMYSNFTYTYFELEPPSHI
jgi:hypothetical protein